MRTRVYNSEHCLTAASGEQGKVDESMQEMAAVEALRGEKSEKEVCSLLQMQPAKKLIAATSFQRELQQLSDTSGASGHQKLRVCEVCGAYLSVLDSDRRLADHFGGKVCSSAFLGASTLTPASRCIWATTSCGNFFKNSPRNVQRAKAKHHHLPIRRQCLHPQRQASFPVAERAYRMADPHQLQDQLEGGLGLGQLVPAGRGMAVGIEIGAMEREIVRGTEMGTETETEMDIVEVEIAIKTVETETGIVTAHLPQDMSESKFCPCSFVDSFLTLSQERPEK